MVEGDGKALLTGLGDGVVSIGNGVVKGGASVVEGVGDGIFAVGKGLLSGVKSIGMGLGGAVTGKPTTNNQHRNISTPRTNNIGQNANRAKPDDRRR